jgi:hypothetical protein
VTWEIPLAEASITTGGVITVTDTRVFCHHTTAVETAMIEDGAVTTAKLRYDAVSTIKIVDSAVTSAKIADGSVTTAKIFDGDVTAAKIQTSAVTTTKIDPSAVTTAKINDSAVTTAKIDASAVTDIKIAINAIATNRIQDSAVTTAKIADSNVTTIKIADSNVTTAKIADDAVTMAKIPNRTGYFWIDPSAGYNNTDSTHITPQVENLDVDGVTVEMPDAKISQVAGYGVIPADYVSGLEIKAVVLAAAGDIYVALNRCYTQHLDDTASPQADVTAGAVTVAANRHNGVKPVSAPSGTVAGDVVRILFRRDAVQATDTLNDACWMTGWRATYTADS